MAIAPIRDPGMAGLMGAVPGSSRSTSAKEAGSGDFLQAFSNAQDQMSQNLQTMKTDGTGAQGKDSGRQAADQNRPQRISEDQQKTAQTKPAQQQKTVKAEDAAATGEVAENTAEVAEEEPDVSAAAQQLFLEIAQMLGITPEELEGALEQLGMDASALLEPSMLNSLVAEVQGGGDPFSLITDGSLTDLVKELNTLVGETVGQLQEENAAVDPDELRNILAEALDQAAQEAPQTGEADPVAETGTEAEGDDAQEGIADRRRHRTEHFEEQALQEAMARMNPDAAEAGAADMAEAVRSQTEQLRYTTHPQEIMDQVLDQIRTRVKDDMTSLDMVLHPASLGHVALNLTSRDGAVTAQLTAQNENVRAALESQIQILKENLEQAGVKVEAVEVTVASHAFEQNLEQGNDRESDAQMQERERLRRATHRINLGNMEGDGAEGLEELGEAEAVNVAMMQADGRRLDYRT